jgi:hypothetical protein
VPLAGLEGSPQHSDLTTKLIWSGRVIPTTMPTKFSWTAKPTKSSRAPFFRPMNGRLQSLPGYGIVESSSDREELGSTVPLVERTSLPRYTGRSTGPGISLPERIGRAHAAGRHTLTRTSCGASSAARMRVRWLTAALVPQCGARFFCVRCESRSAPTPRN